jgi:enoyl-CoA hydratase/carnithine racemase
MYELVISAPGKNALTIPVLESLADGLEKAAGQPVLLTGAGDAFSTGLNLKELAGLDAPGVRRLLADLEALVESLFTHPAPTVALVNGHAIAGGCVLALCCDFRIAAADPRIRIGLNEVALGLPFPPKTLAMVRARLPPAAARRVILGAELHAPAAAKELGLVDEVSGDARGLAIGRLEALARHPHAAYARVKAALQAKALDVSEGERRAHEEGAVPLWTSEETRSRLAAVLERR